ncbi:hypothetical protein HCN44_007206 [Aphidius gifuensis]|uniref:Uncharacterized protein n=1 Tax=Aphidius gifuensis TaxID=684658 RepID=A0A834XMW2_APHGI|nr:hypothetical protein HCN44_007206 [Aphidius gifuensis]
MDLSGNKKGKKKLSNTSMGAEVIKLYKATKKTKKEEQIEFSTEEELEDWIKNNDNFQYVIGKFIMKTCIKRKNRMHPALGPRYQIDYICEHPKNSQKKLCPVLIRVIASKDGTKLVVTTSGVKHNHKSPLDKDYHGECATVQLHDQEALADQTNSTSDDTENNNDQSLVEPITDNNFTRILDETDSDFDDASPEPDQDEETFLLRPPEKKLRMSMTSKSDNNIMVEMHGISEEEWNNLELQDQANDDITGSKDKNITPVMS